ncbi:MAG: hypothetical protein ACI85Q_001004 [Salibacteraceae bacterium]|jgi:hypothetical protein
MNKIVFAFVCIFSSMYTVAQEGEYASDSTIEQLEADTSGKPIILTGEIGFTLEDSIKYSASYQFRDGFYIGRRSFLMNKPITLDKVLTTVSYTDPDIYSEILSTGSIEVLLGDSTMEHHSVGDVFGFVQNRVFYLNMGHAGFVRMTEFAKICKVSFGSSTPRVQPTGGVGVNSWGGASVGMGVQINGGSGTVTQYIFRIDGGPVVEFTPEMLLEMIKDDEIVFNNYVGLNKRYRMKEMYHVFNEYNRRNPLFLPIYK